MVSDDDVNAFSKQQENENTKKKTLYDLKIFREFLETCDEEREIENITPAEFHEVQDILKKKQKQLKSIGKGNRPNAADPLSDENIATFYSCGVVGIDSPRALLNALWLNNCIYFGMRPGKEQRDLCWGDLQLNTDSEGNHFVEFSQERQTKTRTGGNPRNLRDKKPQMYENKNNPDRCPINTWPLQSMAFTKHGM